jgi:hypothetical protein
VVFASVTYPEPAPDEEPKLLRATNNVALPR